MYKLPLLLFSLLLISACSSNGAPPPPKYDLSYQVYSDKNYQYIYRLIMNNADACTKQGIVSRSVVDGQLYNDIKAGDITISTHAPFGKYPHIRIKVDTENDRTRVAVTNDFASWDKLARVIEDWVKNDTKLCR